MFLRLLGMLRLIGVFWFARCNVAFSRASKFGLYWVGGSSRGDDGDVGRGSECNIGM